MTRSSPSNESSRNTRSKTVVNPKTSTPTGSSGLNVVKTNEEKQNLQQILKTNQLLLSQNSEILKKMNDVETAIQFLSNKYEELKEMYERVIAENLTFKKVNTDIVNKFEEIKNDNMEMHITVNELKQNELKKNIVIFGVPSVRDNHSLQLTFNTIMQKLQIPNDEIQIDDIFQKKTTAQSQSPIFVKFRLLQNKIDFKQAAKNSMSDNNKYMSANDLGFSNNNNKIIFVDQLTDINRNLLREAKQLKSHGYKYAWSVNGKILVKRNDGADAMVIRTLDCIKSLKSQNSTI